MFKKVFFYIFTRTLIKLASSYELIHTVKTLPYS